MCRPWDDPGRGGRGDGFTLIEVMLVTFLFGLIALLIFPKIGSFGKKDLKQTARHLSQLIGYLAQESAATRQIYRLYYHIGRGEYWVAVGKPGLDTIEFVEQTDNVGRRRALPPDIAFEAVVTSERGKVTEGEAFTQFYPVGVDKSFIHLKDHDRTWTLEVQSLTGRVKIHEGYIETR